MARRGKGWFGESKRHSLAAQGVKSGRLLQRSSDGINPIFNPNTDLIIVNRGNPAINPNVRVPFQILKANRLLKRKKRSFKVKRICY